MSNPTPTRPFSDSPDELIEVHVRRAIGLLHTIGADRRSAQRALDGVRRHLAIIDDEIGLMDAE